MPTIQETIQKVREFVALSEGWHFGEGVPPSEARIDQAAAFLEYASLSSIERANAFPGIQGQVEVTFYSADRMLEITIEPDSSITIAEDRNREQISFEENLSTSDVYRRLEELGQSVWDSSGHYIANILTQNVMVLASQVAHWTSETENRSRWLMWNAQRSQVIQYARILPGTITSRPAIHGSTGEFVMVLYRPVAELNPRQPLTATIVTGTSTIGERAQFGVFLGDWHLLTSQFA